MQRVARAVQRCDRAMPSARTAVQPRRAGRRAHLPTHLSAHPPIRLPPLRRRPSRCRTPHRCPCPHRAHRTAEPVVERSSTTGSAAPAVNGVDCPATTGSKRRPHNSPACATRGFATPATRTAWRSASPAPGRALPLCATASPPRPRAIGRASPRPALLPRCCSTRRPPRRAPSRRASNAGPPCSVRRAARPTRWRSALLEPSAIRPSRRRARSRPGLSIPTASSRSRGAATRGSTGSPTTATLWCRSIIRSARR